MSYFDHNITINTIYKGLPYDSKNLKNELNTKTSNLIFVIIERSRFIIIPIILYIRYIFGR